MNSSDNNHNPPELAQAPTHPAETHPGEDTITEIEAQDEPNTFESLAIEVRDQDEVERNINRQADHMLNEQAIERDGKRLEKAKNDRSKLETQVRKLENRLHGSVNRTSATAARLRTEIAHYRVQIESLSKDAEEIEKRIEERQAGIAEEPSTQAGNQRLPNESQRDFLIRTGKITPFSKIAGPKKVEEDLQEALFNAEAGKTEGERDHDPALLVEQARSHRVLQRPGFERRSSNSSSRSLSSDASHNLSDRPTKRRKLTRTREPSIIERNEVVKPEERSAQVQDSPAKTPVTGDSDEFDHGMSDSQLAQLGSSEDESPGQSEDEFTMDTPASKKRKSRSNAAKRSSKDDSEDLRGLDDGNEKLYQSRLQRWIKNRSSARRHAKTRAHDSPIDDLADASAEVDDPHATAEEDEWHMPHPTISDTIFEGEYRIPGDIFPSLFDYQKTGVQWLWELYSQNVGGIVGDEMGLGKTIQVIAFLAGLHYSKKLTKPVIVVCPATVMKQWANEFHTWWPAFRVSILHSSGSGMIDIGRETKHEEQLLNSRPAKSDPLTKSERAANAIVDRVVREGHVLVTTYSGLQTYSNLLVPINWGYAVLDEGHKIRNPNAAITLYSKELRTANRVILSGTPMQNNLIELWSLFDFIFPMRLGNLVEFKTQFETPIRIGGYANASNLQIQTAGKCAETLKDAISPYLLQRMKVDVAADLPQKTERVLFCKLTKQQRMAYEAFLNGDDVKSIMNGKRQVLYGVDILRKICNHPDLADHRLLSIKEDYNYGAPNKSGKMIVMKELLDLWIKGGHKTLLFAQHRIMLDILEKYIRNMPGVNYRRMDGTTQISVRQTMVDEFNNNPDAHVFLLTTKVGGLGVNLTGADRVIIFDPDWNPSTDIQARERAWRLGQKREVEIYRLMVAGTIEEKIFHRQIFKQFLTNKILKDPKQRQTFQMQDLHDLFSLGLQDGETETGKMFEGTETRFRPDAQPLPVKPVTTEKADGEAAVTDLAGVSSVRDFQAESDDSADEPPKDEGKDSSDKRIMESLFARSGVHSTVEHDQIINGKRKYAADPDIIEREAKKVAREAGEQLKISEAVARALPAGTVSWTGAFGTAGRPEERPKPQQRRGLSSTTGPARSLGLLSSVQRRQEEDERGESSRSSTPAKDSTPLGVRNAARAARGVGMPTISEIRDYLVAHGGKVFTQMVLDQFKRRVRTPSEVAEFKAMLNEVAEMTSGTRGRGSWTLREEYRKKNRLGPAVRD
ncbi:MAG: hypothetical protein MMC23_002859 [Stictis urceolatum]|nr:hypothetical protein [Stictis urceolata]